MVKKIRLAGYASGLGAARAGCQHGPYVLSQVLNLQSSPFATLDAAWVKLSEPLPSATLTKLLNIAALCERHARTINELVRNKDFFISFGGDHSAAIGTWSGVQHALNGDLGLVWIDAHMDSHTPETTLSGNIHGMPLAALLGYGAAALTTLLNPHPKLKPINICLVGVRSYEAAEAAFLASQNVRIYFMDEVQQRGIENILAEAVSYVKQGTVGYGISLDLDSIDPLDAPGTGYHEPNGIRGDKLVTALTGLALDPLLKGLEIVEFDPERDIAHKTENLIKAIVHAVLQTAAE